MERSNWKIQPEAVLSRSPVMPVMVVRDLEQALPLAKALKAGGVEVFEITLRTPAALKAIELIAGELPGSLVGAGTVTDVGELAAVEAAGGLFAISPGLTPDLLDGASRGGIPLIPGISTASEIMTGLERGYRCFKFFPAEAAGGAGMLRSFAGPFPGVAFCPTGGVSPNNMANYLALPNVACVGGSWLVPPDAVERQDWGRITALAREATEAAKCREGEKK